MTDQIAPRTQKMIAYAEARQTPRGSHPISEVFDAMVKMECELESTTLSLHDLQELSSDWVKQFEAKLVRARAEVEQLKQGPVSVERILRKQRNEADADNIALRAQLEAAERGLVSANEHWHLRVESLKCQVESESERAERAEHDAERLIERCAQVCDDYADSYRHTNPSWFVHMVNAAEACAASIRALAQKGGSSMKLTTTASHEPSEKFNFVPNTDGADYRSVLAALRQCALAWEPKVRVLGNIRAEDIARAVDETERALAGLREGWIPVSERLPKNGDIVYCYWSPKDGKPTRENSGLAKYYYERWANPDDDADAYLAPDYWTSLPAAQKEPSNG